MLTPNKTRAPDYSRDPAEDLQRFLQGHAPLIAQTTEPTADPNLLSATQSLDATSTNELHWGRIQSVVPYAGSYVVSLESGSRQIVCKFGGISATAEGVHDVSTLTRGTEVLVSVDKLLDTGLIISARPGALWDASFVFGDYVAAGSATGFYATPLYKTTYEKLGDHEYRQFDLLHRPYDAIAGDKTWVTQTGVMLHVDSELAAIRASEIVGLFIFRETGTTRLSGERLEIESFARRRVDGYYLDQCYSVESFYTSYADSIGGAPGNLDPTLAGPNEPYTGVDGFASVPAPTDPRPTFVSITGNIVSGKLDVYFDYLTTPNSQVPSQPCPVGYEYRSVRGDYVVSSTSSISLIRDWFPTVPVLPASLEHGTFEPRAADETFTVNSAELDKIPSNPSLAFHELSVHATRLRDFHTSSDASIKLASMPVTEEITPGGPILPKNQVNAKYIPNFARVGARSEQVAKLPETSETEKIDKICSFFTINEAGDLILANGLGAQITLTEGRIEISGLNVFINAASDVTTFANVISSQANKHVEVVSNTGTVTISAGNNLLLASGTVGVGGIVIENFGKNTEYNQSIGYSNSYPGITIKSRYSSVGVFGKDVLINTSGNVYRDESYPGNIIFDAGSGSIVSQSTVHHRLSSAFFDHFGSNNQVNTTNAYTSSQSSFSGSVTVAQQLIVGGMVMAGTGYTTADGHYASPNAAKYNGLVLQENSPDLIAQNIRNAGEYLAEVTERGIETLQQVNSQLYGAGAAWSFYSASKLYPAFFAEKELRQNKKYYVNRPMWIDIPYSLTGEFSPRDWEWAKIPNENGQVTKPLGADSMMMPNPPDTFVFNFETQLFPTKGKEVYDAAFNQPPVEYVPLDEIMFVLPR